MATLNPEAPTSPVALATAGAEFYAQNRHDEALNAYQRFLSSYAGHEMAPDAELGVAASQEALDDYASAAASYEAFLEAHPDSTPVPQAVLGAARCRVQLGPFADARTLYGRGIAGLRLGRAREGRADIAAAERLQPEITATFASYGLPP
mgnify:CR=1 FL=1